MKFNPLANVSSLEVWDFLRSQQVPTNELHQRGFISIGCEPCTRAVMPNQHEREGRWGVGGEEGGGFGWVLLVLSSVARLGLGRGRRVE